MAITLPSIANKTRQLPARVDDNVNGTDGYARWKKYLGSSAELQGFIQTAYDHRTSRAHLIKNSRARRERSTTCP